MEMITEKYLREHPQEVFVFGDNLYRVGDGGAAKLRHFKNTYGFVTKKKPTHNAEDYYTPQEYDSVYYEELAELKLTIAVQPEKTFLISKIGAGLANKFNIFEKIIEPRIKHDLAQFKNVRFLW